METKLPESIPHLANWVIYDNNNITSLCGDYNYLGDEKYNVTKLSIASSKIERICDEHIKECQVNSLEQLLSGHSLQLLDLSGNDFQPSKIFRSSMTQMGKTQIRLGGNTIHCECSALDLADFLNEATTVSNKRLVEDHTDLTCSTGKPGVAVYELTTDQDFLTSCYSHRPLPTWATPLIVSIVVLIILIIIIVIICIKKEEQLRWLVYRYFGKFIGKGIKDEDLDKIEYDAFLSYR